MVTIQPTDNPADRAGAVFDDERLDRLFGALADPTRRAILARLTEGTATVSTLAEPFAMSRPAISKHLNVLETAGLVERRQDGRMTRCRLDAVALEGAYDWLDRYRRYWEASLERLAEYLENE
jgi:DNA-binding transcriptional ArsR family regulator